MEFYMKKNKSPVQKQTFHILNIIYKLNICVKNSYNKSQIVYLKVTAKNAWSLYLISYLLR